MANKTVNFNTKIIHDNKVYLPLSDVSGEGVCDITDLRDLRIKLHNWSRTGIDFVEYCE